jgi:hypothetical protein
MVLRQGAYYAHVCLVRAVIGENLQGLHPCAEQLGRREAGGDRGGRYMRPLSLHAPWRPRQRRPLSLIGRLVCLLSKKFLRSPLEGDGRNYSGYIHYNFHLSPHNLLFVGRIVAWIVFICPGYSSFARVILHMPGPFFICPGSLHLPGLSLLPYPVHDVGLVVCREQQFFFYIQICVQKNILPGRHTGLAARGPSG